MNIKKFFDLRSLTLTSAFLGGLLIVIDSLNHFDGVPAIAITIAQIVTFALTFFGLFNAAKASEDSIIKKFREFATTKFGGSVLTGILTYLANNIPDDPLAPDAAVIAFKAVSALLTVLLGAAGARELFVSARANSKPLPPTLATKYQAYKE